MNSALLATRPCALISAFLDTGSAFRWSAVSRRFRVGVPRGIVLFTNRGEWHESILEALRQCPNLRRLCMAGSLTALGVKALVGALYHCPTLETIDFGDNGIGRLGSETFRQLLTTGRERSICLEFSGHIRSITTHRNKKQRL